MYCHWGLFLNWVFLIAFSLYFSIRQSTKDPGGWKFSVCSNSLCIVDFAGLSGSTCSSHSRTCKQAFLTPPNSDSHSLAWSHLNPVMLPPNCKAASAQEMMTNREWEQSQPWMFGSDRWYFVFYGWAGINLTLAQKSWMYIRCLLDTYGFGWACAFTGTQSEV